MCSVDLGNNKLKDLSPLIKTSGHHLALSTATKTTNETFYINICEPLNPIYGTLCPPGSSACYIKQGSKPVVSIIIYYIIVSFWRYGEPGLNGTLNKAKFFINWSLN